MKTLCLIGMLLMCAFLSACVKHYLPEKYQEAYEEQCTMEYRQSGYIIHILYQNAEYMAARHHVPGKDISQFRQSVVNYGKAHYFSLKVRPENLGWPSDMQSKDILNSAMKKGRAQFKDRLEYFSRGLKNKFYLIDNEGNRISAQTYNYNRNFGLGIVNSFLFVFPQTFNGKAYDISKCQIVFKDFGFNTGTFKSKVLTPQKIKVKI